MTNLVLLRHGESIWNKENRFTGWTSVAVSRKGSGFKQVSRPERFYRIYEPFSRKGTVIKHFNTN